MERASFEELKALRVIDLRKMLTELGLSQSGVKAELVARLDSYYVSMEGSAQGEVEDHDDSQEAEEMEGFLEEEEEVEEALEEEEETENNEEEFLQEQEEEERLRAEEAQKEEAEEAERQRVLIAEQQRAEQERLRLEAQQKAQEAEKQRVLLEKQKREEQERQALIEAQRKAEEWKAERQRELLAQQEKEKADDVEKQRILLAEQEQQRLKDEEAERQRAYLAKYEEQKRLQQEKAQQEAEAARQRQFEAEKQRLEQERIEKLRQQEVEAEKQQQHLFKHQIAHKSPMGSLAGPPPIADDLETSPKKGGPVPLMSLNLEAPGASGEKVAPPVAPSRDVKLPQGLEEVLAFKSKWATQQGHQPSDIARVEREGVVFQTNQMQQAEVKKIPNLQKPVQLVESMDDDDKSKGKKKNKKKKKKKNRPEEWARQAAETERRRQEAIEAAQAAENTADVEVEYIQEKLDLDMSDPACRQFSRIFEAFKIKDSDDDPTVAVRAVGAETSVHNEELKKVPKLLEADDMIEDNDDEVEGEDGDKKLSKRALKKT